MPILWTVHPVSILVFAGLFNDALIFPLDILAVCSKLKVLVFHDDLFGNQVAFSSRAILKFLDKSTSLQTLSMNGVQLVDKVSYQ